MKEKRVPLWAQRLAVAVLILALGAGMGEAMAQPPGVELHVNRVVASGFDRPVQVTQAGDGSSRLFVVEQPGRIRVVEGGEVLPVPFLDVSHLVILGSEQGLLSLAFHPQYPANGFFYINYTRAGDGATVVARYSVSASNPDVADPASAMPVLTVAQPAANHNGGQILFGPYDGYLYIGMGDGGGVGDPADNGQNINTLLGALLRLDVDGGVPYAIPADNPFAGAPGADEIWALGLRNPWRFAFDRASGDLYLGDVGQGQWEEIDFQAAGTPGGVNFGWNCREGAHDFDFTGDCLTATLTDPIAEYGHTEGQAVTGGFVYRGAAYPALQGRYFYADYAQGKIWSLVKTGSNPDTWSSPELELDTSLNISSFGEDEAGELYVVDLAGGTVRQLVDANAATWILTLPLILSSSH
jgi:glucose/arabinose dehydrogenase